MLSDSSRMDDRDPPGRHAPPIDPGHASTARVYDYLLGGKDNFEADRDAAHALGPVMHRRARAAARANRAFMVRAVQEMASVGIDQFLDIGAGIPTSPNVHEVAGSLQPGSRVVYVDHDPIVLVHGRALLEDPAGHSGAIAVVRAGDLRDPVNILHDVGRGLLDLRRPVGLLLVAVLHFVPDDVTACQIIDTFTRRLAPGSCVAISAGYADPSDEATRAAAEAYSRSVAPVRVRTEAEIGRFFDGLELLPPGVVQLTDRGRPVAALAGIGRKP